MKLDLPGIWNARRNDAMRNPRIFAVAISAKLMNQGCTFDDDETETRYVFNRLGELIVCRYKENMHTSKHVWQPGVRNRVDIA